MSTIRISVNCTEFGRVFTPGQLVSDLPLYCDIQMVASSLATFASSLQPASLPNSGLIPITSVQFADPAGFGLLQQSGATYLLNGARHYSSGTALVAEAGGGSGSATGVPAIQTVLGVASLSTDLGTFTDGVIPASSTVKAALQSLETATANASRTYTATASVVVPAGMPMAINPANGQFIKALANPKSSAFVSGLAKTASAIGFSLGVSPDSMTLANWTAITGAALLLPGQNYFLGAAGGLTTVPPSSPNCIALVGVAESTTTLAIRPQPPIQL